MSNYPINPSATDTSQNIISERASQLNAILFCISGEGFDSFNSLNEALKNNVIWACQVLSEDIMWHLYHEDEHLKKVDES